jgi:ribosomal protein L32
MEEILFGGVAMFLFKQGSRNSINNKRREENFRANYLHTFGLRLPHQDTVVQVLEKLSPDKLEQVKMDLMSRLFEQKWQRKHRLLDRYYLVVVDATGVVSFDHRHCENCLTRKSKNGLLTYFHYVLEAKLVTPEGHCFSLATEWIENPEGDFDKQDCERKAFIRLSEKLKKQYPRLPICILADGLYPYEGSFQVCEKNAWKYIFVLQESSLKTVQEELVVTREKKYKNEHYHVKDGWGIASKYQYQTDIPYHKKFSLNWFQCIETRKKIVEPGKKPPGEPVTSTFEYVTNIEPKKENIIQLSTAGRLRWKIENEGFNSQKCGEYEMEHKYCRNSYVGMKNYYTLLQLAHAINQLVEKSKLVVEYLKEHSKETICNIRSNLIAYMLFVNPIKDLSLSICGTDLLPPHPA